MSDLAPDGWIECRGVKIPKSPRLNVGRVRKLLRDGTYERKEADAVLRMVRPGDRVLELGAGLGFMSTLIAVHKPGCTIDSFEANPTLIEHIRAVHALNGVTGATVHNALLAPEDGPPVPFYERENFLGSSMDRDSDPDTIIAEHAVPQRAINAVMAEVQPDVLVCDIEGAEAHLLPAADLSGLRIAVIELHPQWIGGAGVAGIFDAFHRAGLIYWPKASEAKVVCFRRGW